MSSAKFTLIGCYQFFNNAGDDLFKNLTLPEGINKQTLESNILFQGGEFEVQNANPFFIQSMIGIWSGVYADTIQRWVDALAIEYAPLENYDRHEDWTDTLDRDNTLSDTQETNSTGTLDQTTTDDGEIIDDITAETTKSAYDNSSYSPYEKVDTDGDRTTTNTNVVDQDTSESITFTDSASSTQDDEAVHTGRIHGNIGVTTSQQMLNQELDLGYWNLYQRITQLFLQEFTIPVYD